MAHTVEDLIIEIADKHTTNKSNKQYSFLKNVLEDFVIELTSDERCYGDLLTNYLKDKNQCYE